MRFAQLLTPCLDLPKLLRLAQHSPRRLPRPGCVAHRLLAERAGAACAIPAEARVAIGSDAFPRLIPPPSEIPAHEPDPTHIAAVEHFGRHGLTADTHRVALICALLWVDCCRGKLLKMMASCGLKTGAGDDFADNDIAVAMTQLREGHLIVTDPTNPDVFRLADSLRVPLYRELLATHPGETLPQLIRQMDPSLLTNLGTSRSWGLKISRPMTIAYVRASFLAGSSNTELFDLRRLVSCSFDWQAIVDPAIHEGFDGPSFERIEPLSAVAAGLQAVPAPASLVA